jgi:hypothetical protein
MKSSFARVWDYKDAETEPVRVIGVPSDPLRIAQNGED